MLTLEQVGLSKWPFDVVPPTGPSSTWYGRPNFRETVHRIVKAWSFRSSSTAYLLWADFGAGKTHVLRYLQGRCPEASALAVYAELPNHVSDFHGVFQQVVRHIPETELRKAVHQLRARRAASWLDDPGLQADRDTPRVLWQLAERPDDEIGEFARSWLAGERLLAAQRQRLGGVQNIRTSDDALRVLVTLHHLLTEYSGHARFVLLLDEFQRVGQASMARLRSVNSGLHMFYNSCPDKLSIVLSYSIGDPDAIKFLVTDELMSRVDDKLSLPVMSIAEADTFMSDTIRAAATDTNPALLSPDTRRAVITRLYADSGHRLTPRRLMQVFGAIYSGILLGDDEPPPLLDTDTAMAHYRMPTADAVD